MAHPRKGPLIPLIQPTDPSCAPPATELHLEFLGPASNAGLAGSTLNDSILVRLVDENGSPVAVADVAVAWGVASGGGSVSADVTPTSAIGIASVRWTLGPEAGLQQLRASTQGRSATLSVHALDRAPPIAYARSSGVVYATNTTSTLRMRLSAPAGEWRYLRPHWHPSTDSLLLLAVGPGNDQEYRVLAPDGTVGRTLQPPVPGDGEYGMARWSPDGERIVFGGKYNPPECDALAEQGQTGGGGLNHLYLMNADGSDFSPLTEGCRQGNSGARWSPDGSMIAFSSRRHAPSGQDFRPYGVIYLIDPVTGEETRLSAADRLQSPVWSPGGDQLLAYWDWLKGVATVSVADGSHDILFTVDDPAWVLPEVWSPDSQRALVFMGDSPEQGDLHLLDLTTGELTEIANTSKSWGGTDWRR